MSSSSSSSSNRFTTNVAFVVAFFVKLSLCFVLGKINLHSLLQVILRAGQQRQNNVSLDFSAQQTVELFGFR